ncbi:MAG: TonB-dependent receptor [Croceibacterium sp.]
MDAYFGRFGAPAGSVDAKDSLIGFNLNGTLFSRGVFNSPADVVNYRYPIDGSVNRTLYPDVYSYNFDFVNLLVLPLNRDSVFGTAHYELTPSIEVFAQGQWANYTSASGLAPTPVSTVTAESLSGTQGTRVKTALVVPGKTVANQLIIPVTNPFIPTDFRALLATRTGDNSSLVGSGATEPFLLRQRTLDIGLRLEAFDSTVWQGLVGVKAELAPGWRSEAYYSRGRTKIVDNQTGNVDTQRLQALLQAPDGGNSLCTGGFNPFGRQPISQACRTYLEVQAAVSTTFEQQIAQAFVSGELFSLPGGKAQAVLGAEYRDFKYNFDPGAVGGPISGFNAQDPAGGTNRFYDVFGELGLPLVRDASWAQSLDLNFGARYSHNKVVDTVKKLPGSESDSWAYKAELSYQPIDQVRFRAGYQRSVRAPNFGELFDASGDNPQYFDPCSITSTARTSGPNAAKISSLCLTGNSKNPDVIDNITVAPGYVQTPGTQVGLEVEGNPNLKPESADTFTAGLVFSNFGGGLRGLRASIDYYNIKVNDVILQPDANLIIANCYNYFGNNPTYSGDNASCGYIARAGDIAGFGPNFSNDLYSGVNAGYIQTSGVDFQLSYATALPFMSPKSRLNFDLLMGYLIEFKTKELADQPAIDYSGTVSVFGAGLGASAPKWKATLNTNLMFNEWFTLNSRVRYIDGMENRYSRIYVGEQSFTGTDSVVYVDLAGEFHFTDALTFRVGVNNVFDKQPPTYAPNVQSGTDPSLFDVIGRRYYAQATVRF